MIHSIKYVRVLLRKRLDGTISPEETALLRAARKLHGPDVWGRLMAEAMEESSGPDSDDPLAGWTPDFDRVMGRVDRTKRLKNAVIYILATVGAAMVLVICWFGVHTYFQQENKHYIALGNGCSALPAAAEIPANEYAGTLHFGQFPPKQFGWGTSRHVARVGNLEISHDGQGLLVIKERRKVTPADTVHHPYIRITTGGFQLCEVQLPDGTRVRLNASSSLTYPLLTDDADICYAQVDGEALITVPANHVRTRVIVQTHNGQLSSSEGAFAVWTNPWETRLTLLEGGVSAISSKARSYHAANKRGERMRIVNTGGAGTPRSDSLVHYRKRDVSDALRWTRAMREYEDVPLRDFVVDMSRWYGLPATRLQCIPSEDRVSATLCYHAPKNNLVAVIGKAGLRIQREADGKYSFCKPVEARYVPDVLTALVPHEENTCTPCGRVH